MGDRCRRFTRHAFDGESVYVGESVTVLLLLRYVYSPLSRGSLRERGREIETLYMSMIGVASISEVLQILGIDPSSK